MRKQIVLWLSTILLISSFTGCGSSGGSSKIFTNGTSSAVKSSVAESSSAAVSVKEQAAKKGTPNVYFTKNITPKGLMAVYNALGRKATGKVAVKLTVGEPGDTYYLSPKLIKDLVLSVKGTFVDCNTAYGGKRTETAMHLQVAKDHGFTAYSSMDIMDSDGSISLPVKSGKHIKEDMVGSHYKNYDSVIVLSHFKGHEIAGFGGAIKNMSIGIAAQKGKSWIHSAGTSTLAGVLAGQDDFLESMAEAAKAVADYSGDHIMYINVMNNLSIDCDCVADPAAPEMKDVGILASLDPVALDKACVDKVYAAPDGKALQARIESKDGKHTLDYAEQIGLGSKKYKLVDIDG